MKHAIQYDATRPDINPAIDLVIFRVNETFRCHIPQRPCIQVFPGHQVHSSSNAEIDDLDFLLFRVDQKDIFQL